MRGSQRGNESREERIIRKMGDAKDEGERAPSQEDREEIHIHIHTPSGAEIADSNGATDYAAADGVVDATHRFKEASNGSASTPEVVSLTMSRYSMKHRKSPCEVPGGEKELAARRNVIWGPVN